jgi:peptidoglycan/xylan/chitin deacetylase (PgdA/CDA1 family)
VRGTRWATATFLALAAGTGTAATAGAAVPAVAVSAAPRVVSPNRDRVKDATEIAIDVTAPITLTVVVTHREGSTVKTLFPAQAVLPGPLRLVWDGSTDAGTRARDGNYVVAARWTDVAGAVGEERADVVVDTRRPSVRWRARRFLRLTRGTAVVPFAIRDRGGILSARLLVMDQTATRIANVRAAPARSAGAAWVGLRARALARLAPGAYRLRVRAHDVAGNTTASAEERILVDYPVATRVVARFLGVGRRVALTFDDCNFGSAWSSILSTLRRYAIRATFFCPGGAVRANPSLARRTLAAGHAIGDHSWSHPFLPGYSFEAARSQFLLDKAAWWRVAHATPMPYFRPPFGAYNHTTLAAAGNVGYRWAVLWDIDTRDWTRPGSGVIASRVLGETRSGSIVLMHVLPQTAAALPTILSGLRARGYRPLPLNELFLLRHAVPIADGWAR